jgi:hypothetical protein
LPACKAVEVGCRAIRLTPEPDGRIDPDKADRQWTESTDASRQRPPPPADDAPPASPSSPTHPSGGDHAATFQRARTARETLGAKALEIRIAKLKGDLVDRSRATELVFAAARRERDAWLNWPARVAALMAAKLGCSVHDLEQELDRQVRAHLADLAEVSIDLR